MPEKLYLSWEDFHNDVKTIANKIKQSGKYDKIVAISRGGFIPAGILAYELDIRNSAVVNMKTYVGDEHLSVETVWDSTGVGEVDEKTLIVDDLTDSGQTFNVMRKYFPLAKYVAVYAKPKSLKTADITAKELPDKWVVFPWDVD